MTPEQRARERELATLRHSSKLESPICLGDGEPLLVALRHGVHALMGMSTMLLDHRLEGEQHSLMQDLQKVVDQATSQQPITLLLSDGARLLQEHYGAGSKFRTNPGLQRQIRAVCVAMTALEAAGRAQYHPEGGSHAQAPAKRKRNRGHNTKIQVPRPQSRSARAIHRDSIGGPQPGPAAAAVLPEQSGAEPGPDQARGSGDVGQRGDREE